MLGMRRPPQTIMFHTMKARENPQVYTHVEVAWGVSCVNALGYAHRQAPSHSVYTTSTSCLDLCLDLGLDTDLDTDLDIDLDLYLHLDTDRGGVGGGTLAMVTVAPTPIGMTAIIHLLLAAAGSISQHQLERGNCQITMV